MKSELYKHGYKWACEAAKTRPLADIKAQADIEAQADNSFDFNDFGRGALDAVRDMTNVENKT